MKRLLVALFPVIVVALLALSESRAQADVCFGHPHNDDPVDAGATGDGGVDTDGGVAANFGKSPWRLGAGFFAAASLSSGWLYFRRKGPEDKE